MPIAPFVAAIPFAVIAVHLIRVAARSRAIPDRMLAIFFLLIAIGVPPRLYAVQLSTSIGNSSDTFFWATVANVFIGLGLVTLVAFTRQVFRADRAWARWILFAHAAAVLLVVGAGTQSFEASEGASPLAIALNGLGALALSWAFVECVLYYRIMRRRRELGLASPVVVNRFLLWSLWTGALGLQGISQLVLRAALWTSGVGGVLSEHDPNGFWLSWLALVKGSLAVVGPIIVVSVWLSFSPPASYRRWLGAEVEASA